MHMNTLGRTDIRVSRICLGTMTFGGQNDEAQSFRLMDIAYERGVNFFDSAEMYSFPPTPETQGKSEEFLGNWVAERGLRDKVVLATKITGPGERFAHIRGGDLKFARAQVAEAVDLSLKRLKTDVIDLYQTHWPERSANYFSKRGYAHDPADTGWTPVAEVVAAMEEQVQAGKIRAFGLSNETPWGVMEHLRVGGDGPARIASIQNPYSLLNRTFEIGLAEMAIREDVGLFGYSPLGFGALTGKYLDGPAPAGSRLDLYPSFTRNFKPRGIEATRRYVELAQTHGLDPSVMALSFVNSRPFLVSNIIGVTTEQQLNTNLDSEDVDLSEEILAAIDEINEDIPNSAP